MYGARTCTSLPRLFAMVHEHRRVWSPATGSTQRTAQHTRSHATSAASHRRLHQFVIDSAGADVPDMCSLDCGVSAAEQTAHGCEAPGSLISTSAKLWQAHCRAGLTIGSRPTCLQSGRLLSSGQRLFVCGRRRVCMVDACWACLMLSVQVVCMIEACQACVLLCVQVCVYHSVHDLVS
jgi:hypothetical protein